jgi:hypothetical protein
MTGWRLAAAILGVGLSLSLSGQVSADPTCTTFDTHKRHHDISRHLRGSGFGHLSDR